MIIVISPQMGAKFMEYFVDMAPGTSTSAPGEGIERFVFVLAGEVALVVDDKTHNLSVEGYAYLPANRAHVISAKVASRLVVIEKKYVPLAGKSRPEPVINNTKNVPVTALKGDESLPLQKLLPENESFDFEVNTMGFVPGASLHYVETHFMEHGLLMLDGGGVYRLDKSWYSVSAGDVIWMGPFCPQWFGAIGRTNARYLIYKNWNRSPFDS